MTDFRDEVVAISRAIAVAQSQPTTINNGAIGKKNQARVATHPILLLWHEVTFHEFAVADKISSFPVKIGRVRSRPRGDVDNPRKRSAARCMPKPLNPQRPRSLHPAETVLPSTCRGCTTRSAVASSLFAHCNQMRQTRSYPPSRCHRSTAAARPTAAVPSLGAACRDARQRFRRRRCGGCRGRLSRRRGHALSFSVTCLHSLRTNASAKWSRCAGTTKLCQVCLDLDNPIQIKSSGCVLQFEQRVCLHAVSSSHSFRDCRSSAALLHQSLLLRWQCRQALYSAVPSGAARPVSVDRARPGFHVPSWRAPQDTLVRTSNPSAQPPPCELTQPCSREKSIISTFTLRAEAVLATKSAAIPDLHTHICE